MSGQARRLGSMLCVGDWVLSVAAALLPWIGALGQVAGQNAWTPGVLVLPPGGGFIENHGQWPTEELFVGRIGALVVHVRAQGLLLQVEERTAAGVRGVVVEMDLAQVVAGLPQGAGAARGLRHFLVGRDAGSFHVGVPAWSEVTWRSALGAATIRASGSSLELRLPRGATAPLKVEGLEGLSTQTTPTSLTASLGPDQRLLIERQADDSSDSLEDDGEPPQADTWWITFLGGELSDPGTAVVFDKTGSLVVGGHSWSSNFPTTTGPYEIQTVPARNAFVAKFLAEGELAFASIFGGAITEENLFGLALGSDETLYFCGTFANQTLLPHDFPLTPAAFDSTPELSEGYVARLSAEGDAILAATFLGGAKSDSAWGLAVVPSGSVVVVGSTFSSDFPTTPGAFDVTFNEPLPHLDGFVTRLTDDLSIAEFSTYLGGENSDVIYDVEIDGDGSIVVGGTSSSAGYPTTPGAFQEQVYPPQSAVITRLSAAGDAVLASTRIGGAEGSTMLRAIDLLPDGSVVAAGRTFANDLPTTPGAFKTAIDQFDHDDFVFRLTASLGEAIYGTYLGGTSLEEGPVVAVVAASSGAVTVLGSTGSGDFPTTKGSLQPVQPGPPDSIDGYLATLHPDGSSLLYSTYLGGNSQDHSIDRPGVALNARGDCGFATASSSTDLPITPNAAQPVNAGLLDALIGVLPMVPEGVSKYGAATAGAASAAWMGVLTTPDVGNLRFGVTCTDAPAEGNGLLLLSWGALASPARVKGLDLWVDPASLFALLPLTSNHLGWSEIRLPIPKEPALTGAQVFVQSAWLTGTLPAWTASNALAITLQ